MKFKLYDEVDPEQANEIMLISHGAPNTPKSVAKVKLQDPFCSPWFRMYALEGDRVVAQVGAAYPTIETTEGTVKAGFVEAVAGMPNFARRGYAKALMKKVHEQMLDDGIEVFILGTSKTLVAYSMYPKVGYHDMIPFNWGLKNRQKYSDTGINMKIRRHKIEDGDRMFKEFAEGQLGFVHRPDWYPQLRSSWGDEVYGKAVTFQRNEEPIGYALIRLPETHLNVRELVTLDPKDLEPCLRTLENHYSKDFITNSITGRREIFKRFEAHGMKPMESWGVIMAMDAKGMMSQKQVKSLLGIDKDRFQMFTLDTY